MSILDKHYDAPRTIPSRGPRPKPHSGNSQCCSLDEGAQAFLGSVTAIDNTRLSQELEILLRAEVIIVDELEFTPI
ncbi:hypothetical protein DIJ64_02710 [Mycobacterium leprae]|uniref:Uncharacterized protein n=1 Tax=Mycobacterium leprae TaxID=1769 RepID=A0AAD0P6B9_MYCLR|nr:hypothetical protein [Mycobacterium leprae]AWV47392.1 hypothetical protein DIJ64_02710 [Mycobacterium leprae]OAR20235.1 hypothetical protein A8144_03020 [Mycobacterium leprae 3125609]OAX71164.1 hypothetical protein A3216_07405 [Mycobacterium leprae 7935681]